MIDGQWRESSEYPGIGEIFADGEWFMPDCGWECAECGACLGCLRKAYDFPRFNGGKCPLSPTGFHVPQAAEDSPDEEDATHPVELPGLRKF